MKKSDLIVGYKLRNLSSKQDTKTLLVTLEQAGFVVSTPAPRRTTLVGLPQADVSNLKKVRREIRRKLKALGITPTKQPSAYLI